MQLQQLFQDIPILNNITLPKKQVQYITQDINAVTTDTLFICQLGDKKALAKKALSLGALFVVTDVDLALTEQIIVKDIDFTYRKLCETYFYLINVQEQINLVMIMSTHGKATTAYLLHDILVQNNISSEIFFADENKKPTNTERREIVDLFAFYERLANMVASKVKICILEVAPSFLTSHISLLPVFSSAVFILLQYNEFSDDEAFVHARQLYVELMQHAEKGVINLDDASAGYMLKEASVPINTFSAQRDSADYVAKNVRPKEQSVAYDLLTQEGIFRVDLGIPGEYTVCFSMAAIIAAVQMGVTVSKAVQCLTTTNSVRSRMEVVPIPVNYTIIIDNAQTPRELENVLKTLRSFASGNIITVMDLSKENNAVQRKDIIEVVERMSDTVFWIDNRISLMSETSIEISENNVMAHRVDAIEKALAIAQDNDIILLPGKNHKTDIFKDNRWIQIDEREWIKQYFER